METGRIVHADLLEWDTAALPISDLAGRKDSLVWRRLCIFYAPPTHHQLHPSNHAVTLTLLKMKTLTHSVAVRSCLDDGWELIFDTVAFSFIFDNYCPIMT